MANDSDKATIKIIGNPLSYRGRDYEFIQLHNNPFGDAKSYYDELRGKIGIRHLFEGNCRFRRLTTEEEMGLDTEAKAYCFRGDIKRINGDFLEEEITDYDTNIAILRILANQTENESIRSTSRARVEILKPKLIMALADYASMRDENYDWAKQLFNNAKDRFLRLLRNKAERDPVFGRCYIIDDIRERREVIDQDLLTMHHYAAKRAVDATLLRADSNKRFNLVPDETLHPKSIQAILEDAKRSEDYETVKLLDERIDGFDIDLISKDLSPFLEYVSRKMAIELSPPLSLESRDGEVSMRYAKDVPFKNGLLALNASEKERSRLIEVFDNDLYTRVFGLTQEDQYTMMFGRFNTKISFK